MGIKNPNHDDSMPSEPASRRTTNHSKRRKPNDVIPSSTKPHSINPLKSKIRDLTRALEHSDHLPPGVRIEKERALAGYKQDVETILKDKRKNELIKKYHMVRFFERQKATRSLKKLTRRLNATAPETAEHDQLAKERRDAEIDMYYTIYHPLTEKYQSLFPRQTDASAAEGQPARKLVAEKPAMWKLVERCAADGTLEALRDRKLAGISTPEAAAKREPPRKKEKAVSRSERDGRSGGGGAGSLLSKGAVSQEPDEESDGGFFEESLRNE